MRRPLVGMLLLVLILMAPMPGRAASAVGSFEIDGNTVDGAPGEPLDWDSPGLPGLVTFTDGSGQADDTFASSKENAPNEWRFVTGSVPDKTDITGGAIATRELNGRRFLYVNFTRAARNGDTFASFELNTSSATFVNSVGSTVPVRTAGDRLIALFITQGGQQLGVQLRTWSGDHRAGQWNLTGSGVKGVDWDAAVNADNNGRWDFAEAAIDLTSFGFVPGCPGAGNAWIKSTTSSSFETASLADRTERKNLNLDNCATKNMSFSFSPAPIAGTKVFATYTTAANQTKTLELAGPDTNGAYVGTDTKVPPGTLTMSFQVRADVDGDGVFTDVVWTSPVQTETMQANQTRTNVASLPYAISLSPAQAENFAGRPHLLTAAVTHATTGAPLPNVPVTFSVASAQPTGCAALDTLATRTDAQGTATTTLTSATGCSASVAATVSAVTGFGQTAASATAGKTFVSYGLNVAPPSAVNEPGAEHTFTVTLTRDAGSGAAGLAGKTVDLQLNPGVSDAHFVRINGATAGGTDGTCVTAADGTCTATIVASTPGTSTLTASFTTINDSGEGTTTSSGTKTYEDYRVLVSPPDAVNEIGDEHTVTVTVERDAGEGFAPVEGVSVGLSLNAGGTDAQLTRINGAGTSGLAGSCVTDAAGTCTIQFVATQAGAVALTASVGVELDSGTLQRHAVAGKTFSDFRMSLSPASAVNEVGDPHVFVVTLERNDGDGFYGFDGQTVSLSLDAGPTDAAFTEAGGAPASGTEAECVTAANGSCSAVIVSSTPGVVSIGADWTGVLSADSTATRNATATKTYIRAVIADGGCPANLAVPGGDLAYTVAMTVDGGDLTDATLTDRLPAGFRFVSADPAPLSAPALGESGAVVWDLGTVAPGEVSFTVNGTIDPTVASGTVLLNVAELAANEIETKILETATLVSNAGAAVAGRSFGTQLTGPLPIAAVPDTDASNPAELLGVHDAAPIVDVGVMQVASAGGVGNAVAQRRSTSRVERVSLEVAGVSIVAESIVAVSDSSASSGASGSSSEGSTLARLVVNGVEYLDLDSSMTIMIPGLGAEPLAEIRVLERIPGDGSTAQIRSTALTVNGLHVLVPSLGIDLIVSHATSSASFQTGVACVA